MRRALWFIPLIAWIAIVAVVLPRHEPWFDELQAWMVARGSGLFDLLAHRLRYEGTPGLWHTLLWPLAHAGCPLVTLQIAGAVAAAAGAALVFLASPLPLPIRLLLPFSYAFAYQYAVVARSYCLLLALAALVAITWPRRFEHVARFTVAVILLAETSLHGTAIACGIAAAHALEVRRRWGALSPGQRRRHWRAGAAFVVVLLVTAAQLSQHRDRTFHPDPHDGVAGRVAVAAHVVNAAFSDHAGLTIAFVLISAAWFRQRRCLALWLLPSVPLLALFALVAARPWHEGTLFVVWALAAWVSCQGARPRGPVAVGFIAVSCVVLALQVEWTARTMALDWREPYSGSRAAGEWLRAHHIDGHALFGLGWASYAVLPYIDSPPFMNSVRPYWGWDQRDAAEHSDDALLSFDPEWIVLAIKRPSDDGTVPGYDPVADFPGWLLFKGEKIEPDHYIVLRRRSE